MTTIDGGDMGESPLRGRHLEIASEYHTVKTHTERELKRPAGLETVPVSTSQRGTCHISWA
jgi:hypothetical protein